MTDRSSNSNPEEVILTHLDWDVTVDFTNQVLSADATYTLRRLVSTATTVYLDTSNLSIQSVHDTTKGRPLSYSLHLPIEGKSYLGQKLAITLPEVANQGDTFQVTITYNTTKACSALQWLPPAQTAGKTFPYLFTQCQAIHARSLVPCQDRCGVKMTYDASVTVPTWATCVMSALPQGAVVNMSSDSSIYKFKQPIPISSYLLALAVGELVKKDISDRCSIWSEPSVIDAAAYEFDETELFLKTAEEIAGKPYVWERYDLLCLPPSFPYGGMENPCLTFVTPTLLAGDRSLADVVAHEIAHSWTGNLVTNATWDHFWLNEGWTTWFQRKIMARVKNDPKVSEFDFALGYQSLQEAVDGLPKDATTLVLDIGDGDPDDSYSSVAYEKGSNLLRSLERRVGSTEFEAFFKAYVAKFASQTVTTDDFKAFFLEHFQTTTSIQDIDWDAWFYKPGMLPEEPNYDKSLLEDSEQLAEFWMAVDRKGRNAPPSKENPPSLSSLQLTCFLDTLIAQCGKNPLQLSTLKAMNDQYHFASSRNSEILHRYCTLAVAAEDTSILPVVVRFITTQGRMKYVRPLYRALYKSTMGKQLAVSTFLEHKDFYHPICTKMVAMDLKLGTKETLELSKKNVSWIAIGGAAVAATVALLILRKRK